METQNLYIVMGVIFFINLIWLIFMTLRQNKIIKRGRELFSSSDKGDIYELTNSYMVKVRRVENENEKVKKNLNDLISLFKNSFQKMDIMRYNPFKDVGGNLSFSITLLDHNENGFIITNIHSREGDRLYAKPVKGGKSDHNLSNEESKSLEKAINK